MEWINVCLSDLADELLRDALENLNFDFPSRLSIEMPDCSRNLVWLDFKSHLFLPV